MEKLSRPQAPAIFRALFPGLIDWLESPWAGPPQFTAAQSFRVEEMARDNRYVIRAELPGLDPERDIEVTVEGRTLTIHAERRQEDSGPYRSEFRYGSLTRLVRLPARGRRRGRHRPLREGSSARSASHCKRPSRKVSGSRSRKQTEPTCTIDQLSVLDPLASQVTGARD